MSTKIFVLSIEGFYLSFNKVSNVLSILRNDKAILIDTIENAIDYFGYITDDINNDGLLDYITTLLDVDAKLETWYVHDISKNNFAKVEGLLWIVNPIKLDSNLNYFVTFDPQGYESNVWISHLIQVEKSQICIKGIKRIHQAS